MNTSVLLIPNHPAKAANALILARKLAALAQEQGLRAEVSALADAAAGDFSRIVFVGQLPDQLGAFPAERVGVIGLNEAGENAAAALQRVLGETGISVSQSSSAASVAAPAAAVAATAAVAAAAAPSANRPLHFVAITACPTGVAHTFMAADALKQGAAKLGYTIDVETQGSVGAKSILTEESIARADYVILATDIEVDTARFAGKKVYRCATGFALKQTDKAFAEAVSSARQQGGSAASANQDGAAKAYD